MEDTKYTQCQDAVDWKGSLKIVPLQTAPLHVSSLQIYLLDIHSWGNKTSEQGAERFL